MDYKSIAERVLNIEAKAVAELASRLTEDFAGAVDAILRSKGRVIVCGMGKSGIIGTKIAATLASTGTPSFFMHPGEAWHGDLGMVTPDDVFLSLSNSGETDELLRLVPFLKDNGNVHISITGNPASTLATNCNFHLNAHVEQEACPLQLAPTASTTAALAMGDALSVALMEARDFQSEHFARFHPGGSLGKKLLLRVSDRMRSDALPLVAPVAGAAEVIAAMSQGRLGLAIVMENDHVQGLITDGDLRRAIDQHGDGFLRVSAAEMMTASPRFISPQTKLMEARDLMVDSKITCLLVGDSDSLMGVIQLFQCEI